MGRILTKRREHATGIRCVLKGKHIVSTEELYKDVEVCKDTTRVKKASTGHNGAKNTSVDQIEIMKIIDEARS